MLLDFSLLAPSLAHLTPSDRADVRTAFAIVVRAHEAQKREDGTPYALHVIAVAETVAQWGADRDTIIAALLHDVLEDTSIHKDQITQQFGRHVGLLVEGITKFTQADMSPDLPLDRKIETLRKLFDVMRLDMRSIVIKLADRLHNVRTIDSLPTPERRMRFALETLTVYYKIASHLGMRDVRCAFAESCVPCAFPTGIEDRSDRDRLCRDGEALRATVERDLKAADDHGTIRSILLQSRDLLLFHQHKEQHGGTALLDSAFSILIIVNTEEDCYRLLKSLHKLYRPVSGQFHDFIAAPGDAGYRSLQTNVALPTGTAAIECRIQTPEMMEQASRGITLPLFSAEHVTPSFVWLKRAGELDLQTRDSSSAFWEALESDVLKEATSVSVDRKRLSLPKGATALDAAYALYDAKAGFVRSLSVNGRPVALSESLQEDDDVHVTFDAAQQVTFDWLQAVSTQHARLLIVAILKRSDRSQKIALGAALLQKEFDHYNKGLLQDLSRTRIQEVAQYFRREQFDDVLAMVGEGVVRARDVVFYLYPEQRRRIFLLTKSNVYSFRLHVTATQRPGQDVLAPLNGVIRMSDVTVQNVSVRSDAREMATIHISGTCPDRLQLADFIDLLERQVWVSKVQTLITRWQKLMLIGVFAVAFAVIFLDVFLLPSAVAFSNVPPLIRIILPLLPILAVNFLLLRTLQHYIVRLRKDRWYIGAGFLMNLVGLTLVVFRSNTFGETVPTLTLVAVFLLSMFSLGYQFFKSEALFTHIDQRTIHPLSPEQWRALRRQKIFGYLIRLCAVIIWGFQPLLLKYTPASTVDPFVRVYLMSLGATLATALLFLLQKRTASGRHLVLRIPWNFYLAGIVIGQALFLYFISASLLYTTSTNFILLNNFSPVLALLVAALFWRHSIPYLRDPKHMLWIFLLFLMGSTGGSLIIYRSTQLTGTQTALGDILALFAMVIDVLIITSQIRYIKLVPTASTTSLIAHMFGVATFALTIPVLLYLTFTGSDVFTSLSPVPVFYSLGLGAVFVVGMVCNFEAFRRIDGNIAFLMFNLSILINFIAEAFFLKTVVPTWTLMIGGTIIVGATILAECVNSRCERKGL